MLDFFNSPEITFYLFYGLCIIMAFIVGGYLAHKGCV